MTEKFPRMMIKIVVQKIVDEDSLLVVHRDQLHLFGSFGCGRRNEENS